MTDIWNISLSIFFPLQERTYHFCLLYPLVQYVMHPKLLFHLLTKILIVCPGSRLIWILAQT